MTRAVVFGLAALCLGFMIHAEMNTEAAAKPATPKDWTEFFEAVGDLEATMAGAEAMFVPDTQDWRWDECRFQSLDHGLWTAREERLTAECATDKWPVVTLSRFLAIAGCESGMNRFAYNPGGPYVGLLQHALSAYVSRVHTYEPRAWDHGLSTRWTNSRSQIVMSVRMMDAVGLSPWSCARLAERFGMAPVTIRKIRAGRLWRERV